MIGHDRSERDAQLEEIDRRFPLSPHRHALRAAVYWHRGDLDGVARELRRQLDQAVELHRLPTGETDRLTMPASCQLVRSAHRQAGALN
ncbi:MAG: hypothetical protein AAGI91_17345 [Bacteroidota bacterium]